ncbi:DUF927 domain-containing protein [Acidocella facilis]|uniref:DUF927 domain-containing protein n=1 Tax=Acidocella facilis TaxID=525 RepID=UPI001F417E56|nr:DUF927 domain-containing protein [Acidocella facilis]
MTKEFKRSANEVKTERDNCRSNGWYPIPIRNAITGNKLTGKAPQDKGWRQANTWSDNPPYSDYASNTGILCHGIIAIDVDVDETAADAEVIAQACVDAIISIAGASTITRRRAGSARLLMVYRIADGEQNQTKIKIQNKTTGHAVEGLATGQQFVAFGGHYSGTRLEWVDDKSPANTSIQDVPAITQSQIYEIMEACRVIIGGEWTAGGQHNKNKAGGKKNKAIPRSNPSPTPSHNLTVAELQHIVDAIPRGKIPYDTWQPITAAIHNACVGGGIDIITGYQIAAAWSANDPDRNPDELITKWEQYTKGQATGHNIHYLIDLAQQNKQVFVPLTSILPRGYSMTASGLYYQTDSDDKPKEVAGPFVIIGESSNDKGSDVSIIIEFTYQTEKKRLAIGRDELLDTSNDFLKRLAKEGFKLKSAQSRLLKQFFEDYRAPYIRHATKPGWMDGSFALGNGEIIGKPSEVILHPSKANKTNAYQSHGTLADWQDKIARIANGNPLYAMHLCIALAAPLLDMVPGMQGGGFHFYGNSRGGKSTALKVAASVWGKPDTSGQIRSWRTTDNALESIAENTNDLTLYLDELSQAISQTGGSHMISSAAYMLANGQGKGRAAATGEAKEIKTFRLLFVSNGERTLGDLMAADGSLQNAGVGVRMVDVPIDGIKSVYNLHGLASQKDLADALNANVMSAYGHAGKAFLASLVDARDADHSALAELIRLMMDEFKATNLPHGAHPQVQSIAERFALCACAGELAINWGVLPWQPGDAVVAVSICYHAAINARRAGIEGDEQEQARQAVVDFIHRHDSLFEDRLGGVVVPNNRAGWKDDRYYYFTDDGFRRAIKGLNPKAAAKALYDLGFLSKKEGDGDKKPIKINEKKVRLYHISADILES